MKARIGDTIVAIATPIGEGALSVIRVSGEKAIEIVSSRFKGKELLSRKSQSAHFGQLIDNNGTIVDEVVCTLFRAPRSYTGENIVEISCHGGIHVTRRALECLIGAGARPAGPGEFTQRAFLNGKLDLSQAEAVADLICAQSDKAHKASILQLEGGLSRQILTIRERLIKSLGLLELELDFVEDDIELIEKTAIEELVKQSVSEIETLLDTYKVGKVLREGVRVALIGSPNVGKSSLLNALLNEDRAIVTNIPGTTRDFLEEKLSIDGFLFRLIDTAGLRETNDPIEKEGVRRTWNIANNSDIVLLVHDSTRALTQDEIEFIKNIKATNHELQNIFVIYNKTDLHPQEASPSLSIENCQIMRTSAVNYFGIEELKRKISEQVSNKSLSDNRESITVTSERHNTSLVKAREQLLSALGSLNRGDSNEFIALDLRGAIDSIGEIVGLVTTEEILNSIFSKFCIGK